MHLNFFHMIFNLIAVTPLIERFESEFGTLVTLALFTGRKNIPSRKECAGLTAGSIRHNTRRSLHIAGEVRPTQQHHCHGRKVCEDTEP